MDEPGFSGNTDVVVVADPSRQRLLWVPRDLWCPALGNRVNRAVAEGGDPALVMALAEHGIAAQHTVVLGREAAESCLAPVRATVPLERREEFWYPARAGRAIEEGRRRVRFDPPAVMLTGDRVHEWIGARYRVSGAGSDLERIRRQQALLEVLLADGFAFSGALDVEGAVRISGPGALADLRRVRPGWAMETLGGLEDALIDGKQVLLRPRGLRPP